MKKTTLVTLALAASAAAYGQAQADYTHVINKFKTFYNDNQPDSVFSLFSDRIKGIMPLDQTKDMLTRLNENFGPIRSEEFTNKDEHFYYYKTNFSKGIMTLVVALNASNTLQSFRFVPYQPDTTKTTGAASATLPNDLVLKTATGNIHGTLSAPATHGKKIPVVLIIAGSGPTDRDGNCAPMGLKTNTYQMLAESLEQAGIACVRYDKRGIGASAAAMTSEANIRFDDMVKDACGFVEMLKKDPRFSKVIIMGHSEGSLIGMIAASKTRAAAYISVAGLGERADKILEKQISVQSKELAAKAAVILDSLDKGHTVKNVDPALASLFRATVQPYLISWLKYDPAREIKKLTAPVLIIQGTTDIQVGTDQAEILKKAHPTATLQLVTGMNHIMKQAPEDRKQNIDTYANPNLPLIPALMPGIISFINGIK